MNEKKVEKVLDKIRPYIQRDGGDVTLDHLQDDIAYVRFHGACVGCMSLDATFYGVICCWKSSRSCAMCGSFLTICTDYQSSGPGGPLLFT